MKQRYKQSCYRSKMCQLHNLWQTTRRDLSWTIGIRPPTPKWRAGWGYFWRSWRIVKYRLIKRLQNYLASSRTDATSPCNHRSWQNIWQQTRVNSSITQGYWSKNSEVVRIVINGSEGAIVENRSFFSNKTLKIFVLQCPLLKIQNLFNCLDQSFPVKHSQ